MKQPIIEFQEVSKSYGAKMAVDKLSLQVFEGETCVLIGPSGCGKTTSLRMINRLVEPSSGRILLNGRDTAQLEPEQLRLQIGYVIQGIGLFDHMTIAQNIGIVPRLLGWERRRTDERVDELLELVGLEPALNRQKYPRQLSGGEQQRVGVARALAADPPVLLMDEPFGALDPITRERLQDELVDIQRVLRKTIIFVTHDIEEAIKLADKVAIMRAGKLVQCATPQTLLWHPADQFVQDFVGADRVLKALGLMNVREVMENSPPRVVGPVTEQAARDAAADADSEVVFVTDGDGRPLGWIDAAQAGRRGAGAVRDVLRSWDATTMAVGEFSNVRDALSTMILNGWRDVAVVNDGGRLIGWLPRGKLSGLLENADGREVAS